MNNQFHFSLPPTSVSEIKNTERRYGLAFPRDYCDFLLSLNGGSPANPLFSVSGRRGGVKSDALAYVFGVTTSVTARSALIMNDSFLDWHLNENGYWIIGCAQTLGHVVLHCQTGAISVGDLNELSGVPDAGLPYKVKCTFAELIATLRPDPTGEWTPMDWEL